MLMNLNDTSRKIIIITLLSIFSCFCFTGTAMATCEGEGCGDKGNWTDPNGLQGGGETDLFIEWILANESEPAEEA
ncbi:MAG: hypothetical protein AAGD01_06950 [Acidobacteriota bacterium]